MKKFWIVRFIGPETVAGLCDEILKYNNHDINRKYFSEKDAIDMAKQLTRKYSSQFAVFSLHKAYGPPGDVVELEIDITDDGVRFG